MRTLIKYVLSFFLLLPAIGLIYCNAKLYYKPTFEVVQSDTVNTDLLAQLRFLKHEMHANSAAEKMQKLYPEGYLFMHALYGLPWCELASGLNHTSQLRAEAREEINWCYRRMTTDQARSIFPRDLEVPYGAYYSGWTNYFLAKKLSLEDSTERDPTQISLFQHSCDTLAYALAHSPTPFLRSYRGGTWPADVTVYVASLAMHDKLFGKKYHTDIAQWITQVKQHLDKRGLIPHSMQPETNEIENSSQGSSQSLLLTFLPEIDSAFAREQFQLYKKYFLDYRFGLPGIREYAIGTKGKEHIDSGPIILGIGGVASIVGKRAMQLNGDSTNAIALRNAVEAFAFPSSSSGEKKYFFGKLPIIDAFVAWVTSLEAHPDHALHTKEHWRIRFQMFSLLIVVLSVIIVILMWNRKKFSMARTK